MADADSTPEANPPEAPAPEGAPAPGEPSTSVEPEADTPDPYPSV